MEFRPCIDIHNGKVKQIVGGSLKDGADTASENFVSGQDAAFYAEFYKKNNLKGGHVILLNAKGSEYYEKTRAQAISALRAYIYFDSHITCFLQIIIPRFLYGLKENFSIYNIRRAFH